MKTLKFSTLLIALASVFTFSSCLDSGNDDYGNRFRSYVTITGGSGFGYTFHDDVGCTLKPTAASIQAVLPGLAWQVLLTEQYIGKTSKLMTMAKFQPLKNT